MERTLARVRVLLRTLLLDNVGTKLGTLLVAVVAWGWIQGEQVVQVAEWVAVSYQLPEELVLTQAPPERVRATLSGSRGALRQVRRNPEGLSLAIDLRELGPGLQAVDFASGDVQGLAPAVQVVSLAPNALQLELETKERTTVGLEAATIGEVAEGYRIVRITLEPSRVPVQGPASQLARLEVAATEGIPVAGIRETTTRQVGVTLPRGVDLAEEVEVQATIEVEAVSITRTFLDVPVVVRTPGWEPQTGTVEVRLSGPVRDIQGVKADAVTVMALVSPSASREPLSLSLGSGASRLEVVHSGGSLVQVSEITPSSILVEPAP